MAAVKTSGLGDNFYIGGYDLSGDVGSLGTISGGPAPLEVTAISQSAFDRLGGLRSGTVEFNSFFDDQTGQEHPALSTLLTTDRIVTYMRGTTAGNQAACMTAKQIDYNPTRAADGSLTVAVQTLSNGKGLEWGNMLTAGVATVTGSLTSTASVDLGGNASESFGFQAYLQVFSFTGVDLTVRIQHSSDNNAGDPWANITNGVFTQVTAAPTAERIESASRTLAVERYVRVTFASTGGITTCNYAVVFVRNTGSVVF